MAEIALGRSVGVLIDGASGLVGAVLAVAGVAIAEEFLRKSDSDYAVRIPIILDMIVTKASNFLVNTVQSAFRGIMVFRRWRGLMDTTKFCKTSKTRGLKKSQGGSFPLPFEFVLDQE